MRKKIYSLLLMATMLLVSGSSWANVPQAHHEPQGYAFNPEAPAATVAAPRRAAMDVAQQQIELTFAGNTSIHTTLQAAFNALPKNSTPATIKLLTNVFLEFESGTYVKLDRYHNVTLDLNNFTIYSRQDLPENSQVIMNEGTLIIDDTSVEKDGMITNCSSSPDTDWGGTGQKRYPTFGNYTINNRGTLILNNGIIESASKGGACYAVENQTSASPGDVLFVMNGGVVRHVQGSTAIRLYGGSTTKKMTAIFNGGLVSNAAKNTYAISIHYTMDNALINLIFNEGCAVEGAQTLYSWRQTNGSKGNTYIEINGGTLTGDILLNGLADATKLPERVRVHGGTIMADNAIYSYSSYAKDIEIDGGTFYCSVKWSNYYSIAEWMSWYPGNWASEEECEAEWISLGCKVENGIVYRPTSTESAFSPYIVDGYCKYYTNIDNSDDYWTTILPCTQTSTGKDGIWTNGETWGGEENIPTASTNATVEHDITIGSGEVEANQIEVTNEGQIIVGTGSTLTVGNGGIVTDNTTKDPVIVEAGGTLVVGGQGITNTGTKDLIIEADEANGSGVLVFNPNTPNTGTKTQASVNLHTYSKKVDGVYSFQLFGTPVTGVSNTNKPTTSESTTTYMYMWDYEGQQAGWRQLTDWAQLNTPFAGYNVTNTSNGGVIYTFRGDLIGNGNQQLVLPHKGYCVMGNSYTAPIDVRALFAQIDNDMNQSPSNSPIEKTVYVYNAAKGQYMYINELGLTLEELGIMQAPFNKIQPMQGFLLNLQNGTSAGTTVNYANAVFNPIINPASSAPARAAAHTDLVIAKMSIRGGNFADQVSLVEGDEFSAEVENGKDALKYVDTNNISLYANNNGSKLAMVATDNLEGTTLAFQAKIETTYTITFDRTVNCDYVLCDYTTGQQVAIVEGNSYTFTAEANSFNPARFGIAKANKIVTGMDALPSDAQVTGIYTVLGQYLGTAETFNSLPAGIYIVNGAKIVK